MHHAAIAQRVYWYLNIGANTHSEYGMQSTLDRGQQIYAASPSIDNAHQVFALFLSFFLAFFLLCYKYISIVVHVQAQSPDQVMYETYMT